MVSFWLQFVVVSHNGDFWGCSRQTIVFQGPIICLPDLSGLTDIFVKISFVAIGNVNLFMNRSRFNRNMINILHQYVPKQ